METGDLLGVIEGVGDADAFGEVDALGVVVTVDFGELLGLGLVLKLGDTGDAEAFEDVDGSGELAPPQLLLICISAQFQYS